MGNHFGCDASSTGPQVIPTVTARLQKPEFIGRYLLQLPGVSTGLTKQEVSDIHAQGIAVLLTYNGATIGSVRGDHAAGLDEGVRAGNIAKSLGADLGCAVIADIETNMYPTPQWMAGYLDGVAFTKYAGGFYGNANVGAFVSAYQAARQLTTAPCYFWASEPELNEWFDTVRTDFTPLTVPGYAGDCVVHQYSENNLGRIVDLDVATPAGLALMWCPTPVTHTTTIFKDCSLKHFPSHIGPGIHNHNGVGEYVAKAGSVVTFTGRVSPHWAEITTVADHYTGWLLRENLRTV